MQRVSECSVSIDGTQVARTGAGLLVLVGVAREDTEREAAWLAEKVLTLRIFPDAEEKMNVGALDVEAEIMVVSQFTLLADCSRGRRPSFIAAARGREAERLYELFAANLSRSGLTVKKGVFGAMMEVALVNSGPVTVIIDTL